MTDTRHIARLNVARALAPLELGAGLSAGVGAGLIRALVPTARLLNHGREQAPPLHRRRDRSRIRRGQRARLGPR